MTLWDLCAKQIARISRLEKSLPETYQRRLVELGLGEGCEVKCLRVSPFSGPKDYQLSDGVFSVDQEIAKKIGVTLL